MSPLSETVFFLKHYLVCLLSYSDQSWADQRRMYLSAFHPTRIENMIVAKKSQAHLIL